MHLTFSELSHQYGGCGVVCGISWLLHAMRYGVVETRWRSTGTELLSIPLTVTNFKPCCTILAAEQHL